MHVLIPAHTVIGLWETGAWRSDILNKYTIRVHRAVGRVGIYLFIYLGFRCDTKMSLGVTLNMAEAINLDFTKMHC